MRQTATLIITGKDQKGLVYRISEFIFRHQGNILHADHHIDFETGLFLSRVEWDLDGFRLSPPEIARAFASDGIELVHLSEPRPGKIVALERAMAAISTEFVAFGDADTFYPARYLATAQAALDADPRVAAAMATDVPLDPAKARRNRRHNQIVSRLWPKQTHTGGFGQTFRTRALVAAGGYAERYWPYVLMDHEIMERMVRQGRAVYPYDLWCSPSTRRADRRRVRWTLSERLLYHFSPARAKPWFFYRFLGPRLERRRQGHLNLRERNWK